MTPPVPPPAPPPAPSVFVPVQPLRLVDPLRWLQAGWQDLRAAPLAALFYGLAFAAMGGLISWVFSHAFEYVAALASGFLLVGPFVATGLYDIARRREAGEPVRLVDTLVAWRAAAGSIGLFSLVLTVILLVWARASLVTFALFFSTGMPTLQNFVGQVLSVEHLDFVLTWFSVGFVFAALVFAASVVTVPQMLDRAAETVPAVLNSARAVAANPGPMGLWAALIVVLVGAGFATLFVGLVLTGPLVGLATWHAYRAVLAPRAAAAAAMR